MKPQICCLLAAPTPQGESPYLPLPGWWRRPQTHLSQTYPLDIILIHGNSRIDFEKGPLTRSSSSCWWGSPHGSWNIRATGMETSLSPGSHIQLFM